MFGLRFLSSLTFSRIQYYIVTFFFYTNLSVRTSINYLFLYYFYFFCLSKFEIFLLVFFSFSCIFEYPPLLMSLVTSHLLQHLYFFFFFWISDSKTDIPSLRKTKKIKNVRQRKEKKKRESYMWRERKYKKKLKIKDFTRTDTGHVTSHLKSQS